MADLRDVFVSAPDAQALCAMLVDWPRRNPMEVEAAIALTSALDAARVVPAAQMPEGVVKMGSTVTYLDRSTGRRQTVTVVHPAQADAGSRRVSVLSPIGRALLGHRTGSRVDVLAPSGRRFAVQVEDVAQAENVARRRTEDAGALALA
ncbi:MAG: GreA/GreB family elongation factor [Burkholderiales bacterium]